MKVARRLTFNDIALFCIFALYPILPTYFRIGPAMIYYFLLLPCVASVVLLKKKIHLYKEYKMYIPYIFIMFFLFAVHVEVIEAAKFVLAPIFITIFLLDYVDSKEKFDRAIDILLFFCAIMCFLGLLEGLKDINLFKLLNNSNATIKEDGVRMGLYRTKLSFNMSTNYGNYLVVMISLVLYRLSNMGLTLKRKILYIGLDLLIIANAVCAGARATLIVTLLLQFVYIYKFGTGKFFKIVLGGLIAAALGFLGCEIIGIDLFKYVKSYFYVFLSLFSDKFQKGIEVEFGTNLTMSTDRVNLYSWVLKAVKGHIVFGMGEASAFKYEVNQWRTKTSLENYYLSSIYHYGIVGLVGTVYRFLVPILFSLKRTKTKVANEKIGFNFFFFTTCCAYCLVLFTVSLLSDARIFSLFVILMLIYNIRIKKGETD